METEESVIWQNETSVWFQKLTRMGPQEYTLQREYTIDPLDGAASTNLTLPASPSSIPGATMIQSIRRPEWPSVDVYELKNERQLALLVLEGSKHNQGIADAFERLGRLMADHHSGAVATNTTPYHAGRLANFIERPSVGSPAANLLKKLSDDRARCLQPWVDELKNTQVGVPSHGNMTMNSVFVGDDDIEFPYGPEACSTFPEYDVGWLLGELTELEYSFTSRKLDGQHIPLYARSFVEAYERSSGALLDIPRLARVVAMRICLHYLDFSETMPTMPIGMADMIFLEWLIDRARELEGNNVEQG